MVLLLMIFFILELSLESYRSDEALVIGLSHSISTLISTVTSCLASASTSTRTYVSDCRFQTLSAYSWKRGSEYFASESQRMPPLNPCGLSSLAMRCLFHPHKAVQVCERSDSKSQIELNCLLCTVTAFVRGILKE
jgi:hypothetical protein